jgi:predicted MFS family arabinose efflux permease
VNVLRTRLRLFTTGLPPAYWYLWGGTLLNRLGAFVVPFLTLYLTETRGLALSKAALAVSLYGGGAFLANLAGGLLADRIGRRATMTAALVLSAFTLTAFVFVRSYALIATVTLLLGFFAELYRPAAAAAIADLVAPEHRVRAYGLMYWVINVGAALAPILGGFIASRAFAALFLLDAATTFVFGLIIYWRVPETRPDDEAPDPALPSQGKLRMLLRDPELLCLAALAFLFAAVFFQAFVTLPIDMKQHGLSVADYGLAIAVNGTLIVLLGIPASDKLARFRPLRTMAAAGLLLGMGFGLTGLADTMPLYALSIAVWTLGELLYAPVAPALFADLSPVRLRGLYQGVHGAAWGLAKMIGPAAGGALFEYAGAGTLWSASFVVGLVITAGCLALAGPLTRRLHRMRQAAQATALPPAPGAR